jgi:hypothetical protein
MMEQSHILVQEELDYQDNAPLEPLGDTSYKVKRITEESNKSVSIKPMTKTGTDFKSKG